MTFDFSNPDQKPALDAIRRVLEKTRWDAQGGYFGYNGNGEWIFESMSLDFSAEEVNALFALVGMCPDEIIPLGHCRDCANSFVRPTTGERVEQGYDTFECRTCARPKMSNFVPLKRPAKKGSP